MGLFSSEKKLSQYANVIQETAENAVPEVKGFNFTLLSMSPAKKDVGKRIGKLFGMNLLLAMIGFRATPKGDLMNAPAFIVAFQGADIYFLPIGYVNDRLKPRVVGDRYIHITSNEIESVVIKKYRIQISMKNGNVMMLNSKIGEGSAYSTPKGEKQFYEFLEAFDQK